MIPYKYVCIIDFDLIPYVPPPPPKFILHHHQVKGVMVENIEKVTQRGEKLEDLGERAGETATTTHFLLHISVALALSLQEKLHHIWPVMYIQ